MLAMGCEVFCYEILAYKSELPQIKASTIP